MKTLDAAPKGRIVQELDCGGGLTVYLVPVRPEAIVAATEALDEAELTPARRNLLVLAITFGSIVRALRIDGQCKAMDVEPIDLELSGPEEIISFGGRVARELADAQKDNWLSIEDVLRVVEKASEYQAKLQAKVALRKNA